jgi:hypothetical protein
VISIFSGIFLKKNLSSRLFDGNALGGTEHRLEVLRNTSAGALPGKSLVVLDPAQMLAIDLFPTEDGHACIAVFIECGAENGRSQ